MALNDTDINLAIQRVTFGDVRKLLRAMETDPDARLRIELACLARLKDKTMTTEAAGRMLRVIARSLRRLKRPRS